MDPATGAPGSLVIGQDEDSEIRVQPVAQGGIRHLDIRIWRRGPSGFAPTRDALMLDRADLESLRQAIIELLEVSGGGRQVARIVLDTGDGRRLRAETEPFGTRYVAHLGFWQRARNTWRPDGDGIVISADRLSPLQGGLLRYEPWLGEEPSEEPPPPADIPRPAQEPWPLPGADWMTIEPNRVAFHPRGIRITLAVEEHGDRHWLTARQWRRESTLWVPESVSLVLGVSDVHALISCLRRLLDKENAREEISCADASALRVALAEGTLRIEQRLPSQAGAVLSFEPRLTLPAVDLSRFGRALVQSWSVLAGWLSDTEREQLASLDLEEIAQEPQLTPGVSAPTALPTPPAARAIGPVVRFGEDSENPGAVIPQEGQVRVTVDGYLLPRGITLPIDVVARVVTGLEELCALQFSQTHLRPMLMCDRPDCAVYGRVGTTTRPEAVEIRVWTSPRTSESVTFDRAYLPELIDGLRHGLRILGQPEPLPAVSFATVRRAVEQIAPPPEPVQEQPVVLSPPPPSVQISELRLGEQLIKLDLMGSDGERSLAIRWDGQSLALPLEQLDELISDVRSLYYEALRGRRGQMLTVGDAPPIDIRIHHEGSALHLQLTSQIDGESACLSFPLTEIPAFLDAVRGALLQV